jgi:hypothetical protein
MWQIANILFNLTIIIEVVYLFTCGQRYMKMSVLRARRKYFIEKVLYALIGSSCSAVILYSKTPEPATVIMNGMFTLLLYRKCVSVKVFRKRVNQST